MTGINNVTPATANSAVTTSVSTKDGLGDAFSSILDSLNIGTKSTETPADDTTASALKETIVDLFNGDIDAVKEDLASLSDEDKATVMSLLQTLVDIADAETTGETAEGSSQTLIDSLLGIGADNSNSEDKALETLKQSLSDLEEDNSADISEILSQLISIVVSLNAPTATDSGETSSTKEVAAIDGSISVQSGTKTQTLSLDSYAEALQEILDEITAKTTETTTTTKQTTNADGTTTTTTTTTVTAKTGDTPKADTGVGTASPAAELLTGTGSTTAGTDSSVVSSTVTVTTTTDTTAAADTTASTTPITPTARTTPITSAGAEDFVSATAPKTTGEYTNLALTVQKPSASDKLMSEGNITKTSVLSQRVVQKTDELETLTFDLSNTAGLTAQTVQQSASIEIPQTVSEVPVEKQIMDNITTQMSTLETGKTSEMTMTLNPDNLGQISVKLQNELGKITVTIAAQSEITQKLLQDKLPSLIANLQTVNTDVKDVRIVESAQSADFASFNLNNSDAGQSSSYSSPSSQTRTYSTDTVQQAKEIAEDTSTTEYTGGSKLWQTA